MATPDVYQPDDIPSPEEAYERLSRLSRLSTTKLSVPRASKFSRSEVVASFAEAFTMIGGTTRLALWANDNPGEFYRLFGKLLPSSTMSEIVHTHADHPLKSYTTEELELMLQEQSAVIYDITGDAVDDD